MLREGKGVGLSERADAGIRLLVSPQGGIQDSWPLCKVWPIACHDFQDSNKAVQSTYLGKSTALNPSATSPVIISHLLFVMSPLGP